MNKSNINQLSAETEADSNSNAQNQQVSQPNANTNVSSRLSDVMPKFGKIHDMLAKTSLSKKEYNPISLSFAEAKVELFNTYLQAKEEINELIGFFEHVSNPNSEWFFRQGFWYKEGYKTRTTQELFEYHLTCKGRGMNGC